MTVSDDRGQTVRRERYTRREVEESAGMLWNTTDIWQSLKPMEASVRLNPTTCPAPTTRLTDEQRRRQLEQERRLRAIAAATQPATLELKPDH